MTTPNTLPLVQALGSGLAGAVALNVLHETVRQFVPDAPRADLLGKRSLKKGYNAAGLKPPKGDNLYVQTMVGDVLANTVYYSMVGLMPAQPVLTGAALGVLAGVGAVTLPGQMGLGEKPTNRTTATQGMTVGWYLFGGLVAGTVFSLLQRGRHWQIIR